MLTDKVRRSCTAVIARGRVVRLNESGLSGLADEYGQRKNPPVPELEVFDEARALRSFAANAINFGSGYHDVLRKEPGMSGAQTMLVRLMRYLDATGPLSVDRLSRITAEDCSQIFGQEMDGDAAEQLMSRFAIALNDLGEFMADHGGTALSVLVKAEHSAVALAEMLLTMPFYRDVDTHDGEDVAFYKRAQITPADLYREGIWQFEDLSELTAFADNLVPHVLRLDGAIEVDPDVVGIIDSGQRLVPGEAPEVELRAAAVVCVDDLVRRINNPLVWAMHVDEWLWERGGGAEYKAVRRPRSRSVFY